MHHPRSLILALAIVALTPVQALVAAPWLVFTEVKYSGTTEFVELLNLEAPTVDLGGWRLEGAACFEFPAGTRLGARECLVVAGDPAALAAAHPRTLKAGRVLGPLSGPLSDDGGRFILLNTAGAIVAEMRYGRGDGWTSVPNETGHTLVLRDHIFDPTNPRDWIASERSGGSPGVVESLGERPRGELIVKAGETWRFFRGRASTPHGWSDPHFDDSRWELGPSGFGFADGDDATVLNDMRGSYLTVYTRKTFQVEEPSAKQRLFLRVDFDDSFRAVLNGREIARVNLPEGPLAHDTAAIGQREAGGAAAYDIGLASESLRPGANVLAVECHNSSLRSSDLSLIVELESRDVVERAAPGHEPIRLSELALDASGDGFSIELENPARVSPKLGALWLSDDASAPRKHRLPAELEIPARGFAVLSSSELGMSREAFGRTLFLSSATRVTDAMPPPEPIPAVDPLAPPISIEGVTAYGRPAEAPDMVERFSKPTPGAANRAQRPAAIVINELLYSPRGDDPEFVELFNAGNDAVDLEGFRLRDGVRFDFAPGTRIEAGGYLVVSSAPETLASRHELPAERVLGPFVGSLSNGGERLLLLDPRGAVVDRVEYDDHSPWPREPEEGNTSLELVHPDLDNALAASWASSDDARRSEWREYRAVKRLGPSRTIQPTHFQLMLLEAGSCLIDDIVVEDTSGTKILEERFDEKTAARWTAFGTHTRSERIVEISTGQSYNRIVAEGKGSPRFNYIAMPLPAPLVVDQTYTVSFRARWLAGSPLLLARASGQGIATTHRLDVPPRSGSPGRRNTRFDARCAPALGTPRHTPVVPGPDEAMTISVAVSARSAVTDARVHYRVAGRSSWSSAPLAPAAGVEGAAPRASVLHEARIPPLAADRVEFWVEVREAKSPRAGTFPGDAPERTALYTTGTIAPHRFPTYTLLIADREWQAFQSRQRQSNLPMRATFVYGDSRIFHDVRIRLRGSPFTRGRMNWRVVFGQETLDGRRNFTLDAQQGNARNISERLTYWMLDELDAPSPRQRYANVRFPGQPSESSLYEDVEKVDSSFLERWFERRPAPPAEGPPAAENPATVNPATTNPAIAAAPPRANLHKVDDHWELAPAAASPQSGFDLRRLFGGSRRAQSRARSYVEARLNFRGRDPESYRWNFPPRSGTAPDDMDPLMDLIGFMDPNSTGDARFNAELDSRLDVDTWLRVLAARTMANDWDSIGRRRGKNAYLYRSARDGLWRLLPWDADLSWSARRYSFDSIHATRFRSFARMLAQPELRRRFHAYVAFLVERRMNPERLGEVLGEFRSHVGSQVSAYRSFAEFATEVARRDLPAASFQVTRVERVPRENAPDLARIEGTAPPIVLSLTLDGREGEAAFPDDIRWSATFPIGPEGGALVLAGRDASGEVAERTTVTIPARAGARALER